MVQPSLRMPKNMVSKSILFLPFVPDPLLLLSWRTVNQSGRTITDMQVVCWVSQAGAGWQAMGALRLQAPFHCPSRGWFGGRWWCKAAASNRIICGSLLIDDPMTNVPPPHHHYHPPLCCTRETRAGEGRRDTLQKVLCSDKITRGVWVCKRSKRRFFSTSLKYVVPAAVPPDHRASSLLRLLDCIR